jgi:hypothetical protein
MFGAIRRIKVNEVFDCGAATAQPESLVEESAS